jgi:hypothetical protein
VPPRGERTSNACVDALGSNNVGAKEGVIQSPCDDIESQPRVLPCLHFQSRSVSDFAAQMGNSSLDLVNGVECGMSIVMMQLSAGSCLGCEKLTVEESRLKTDVRPPICFLMSKNGEGPGSWTCERSS